MDISVHWLKDYINLDGLTLDQLSHTLTDIGLEVEAVKKTAAFDDDVVIGHVLEAMPHPNADSLKLCKVDVGGTEPLQIVCGAPNARVGITVCVATVGAALPGGLKIKEAKIRGEASFGMLCSAKELGLSDDHGGIIELTVPHKAGTPVVKALGLDDAALTLNVTPNRADCLGHIGVARDLSAKLHRPLKLPACTPKTTPTLSSKDIKIAIESDHCARFAAMAVRDVRPVTSPEWLRRRLESTGMRPINLIVDLTNYVMLEMNQPVHAYDERDVAGRSFVVREARDGETFTTLDNNKRELKAGDLLICDSTKPIGLAGVMGGLNSEVKADTTAVILEVAYFNPNAVRSTSRRLGIHSEASHRFERGVDMMAAERVAKRFGELLLKCVEELNAAGGSLPVPQIAHDVHDVFPVKPQTKLIALRVSEAKNFLASPHLTQESIKKFFDGLAIRLVDHNQDRMVFEIPSWRVDIERECDLIEEVGRLQGYDKVPNQLPVMSLQPTPEEPLIDFIDQGRIAMASQGLRETISFPFWSDHDAGKLRLPESHPLTPTLKLANPIAEDARWMQTTLVHGLIKAVESNRRHGLKGARLFEVGRGYYDFAKHPVDKKSYGLWKSIDRKGRHLSPRAKNETHRPTERHWVAGIIDQPLSGKSWNASEVKASFFDGKKIVLSWLRGFGITDIQFHPIERNDVPFVHPGASAYLFSKGQILGWVGELHPETTLAYDLEVSDAPVLFELDLEAVLECSAKRAKVETNISKFPPSSRDLALLVEKTLTHDAMSAAIGKFNQGKHLKKWHLFDVYEGSNIPDGKKSVAWSFSFQSNERTLTDQEIEGEFKNLTQYLTKTFNAEQR